MAKVQGAIRTIFAQFERLGTATAVLHFFNNQGLKIPRRRWHLDTGSQIVWMRPSYQAIHTVLMNPTYAGAYVYGRRGHDRGEPIGLGSSGARKRFALDQVEVLLHDHHPAYLSWERYLANRAALQDNSTQFEPSRGSPRHGSGLLQGVVVCGRCGCRMHVQYGKPSAAYICDTRHRRYGEPLCQSLTIDHVDRVVSEAFLQVIKPAQVEAALALAEELERDRRRWNASGNSGWNGPAMRRSGPSGSTTSVSRRTAWRHGNWRVAGTRSCERWPSWKRSTGRSRTEVWRR